MSGTWRRCLYFPLSLSVENDEERDKNAGECICEVGFSSHNQMR